MSDQTTTPQRSLEQERVDDSLYPSPEELFALQLLSRSSSINASILKGLVFGPSLDLPTAWIKDNKIVRLASSGVDISSDSVLRIALDVINPLELRRRCDDMKSEEECHAAKRHHQSSQ